MILQQQSYEASHHQADGARKKPPELEAIYRVCNPGPKGTVILVDDVLTTGAHFVAARNVILAQHPATRVIGFFIARRVPVDAADDFDVL